MVDHTMPRQPAVVSSDDAEDTRCFVTRLFGKRALNREAQVERILSAATACFIRAGFRGASMNDICSEAGMSPGALYRYFPSKEAIIEHISAQHRRESAEILDRMASTNDIIEAVVKVGIEHVRHMSMNTAGDGPADAHARLFMEVRAEATRNDTVAAICDLHEGMMREKLLAAFTAAKQAGLIDPVVDLELAVATLAAMGEGIILRNFPAQGVPLEALEPVFRALATAVLRPANKQI
ncbi:TetR/AcrR family transcriptional regulator [Phyllobacterium sp. YR531]|uniref:TetR/AcrR family transcriptional regulator n=1 Tax=Phyllobacterium sp. YR531 TaxID=1144343 RepID=UPI00026F9843|nr:TetR/AcrR family transcriptional regulator [Phyllobacterium sp. YR531]EJN06100.1 transcriptional regulator [Phyllobacterium sp. YR531]